MKKNIPLTSDPVNRSFDKEMNWDEIEEKLSVKSYLFTREIGFFAHSDTVMKDCLKLLDSKNLIFKNFNNFSTAIRSGIAQTADVLVLVDKFASASHSNFAKLVQNRTSNELQVIIWRDSSIEDLVFSIKKALSSINQIETQKMVVEKIVRSRTLLHQSKPIKLGSDSPILSEKDFRNLLVKELNKTENHAPETILAKAIQVIKELE